MEFLKKYYQVLVIVALLLIFGYQITATIVKAAFPKVAGVSEDVIEAVIGDAIDRKVAPLQESLDRIEEKLSYENDFAVQMILLEVADMRTAEEVDSRINFLEDNNWNSQLAALRYLANNHEARAALEKMIIYEPVRLALMARIAKY